MIGKITKAYVRTYSDSGQVMAYVEWVDGRGKPGRTEGKLMQLDGPRRGIRFTFGSHMHALFSRARREGVRLQREVW